MPYPVIDIAANWRTALKWQEYNNDVLRRGYFSSRQVDNPIAPFEEWLANQVCVGRFSLVLPTFEEGSRLLAKVPAYFVKRREDGVSRIDTILSAYHQYLTAKPKYDSEEEYYHDGGMRRALYVREGPFSYSADDDGPQALWWAWSDPDKTLIQEGDRATHQLFVVGMIRLPCVYCGGDDCSRMGGSFSAELPLTWDTLMDKTATCARCAMVRDTAAALMRKISTDTKKMVRAKQELSKAVAETEVSVNITKAFTAGTLPAKHEKRLKEMFNGKVEVPHTARQAALCAYAARFPSECPPGVQRDIEPWARRIAETLKP